MKIARKWLTYNNGKDLDCGWWNLTLEDYGKIIEARNTEVDFLLNQISRLQEEIKLLKQKNS